MFKLPKGYYISADFISYGEYMRLIGKKVSMNGLEGVITGFDIEEMKYGVEFDDEELGSWSTWYFSYDEIKDCIIEGEEIKCECGIESSAFTARERSAYAHATWCAKFKGA